MAYYNWNSEKNILLKKERCISFEQIVLHIENGNLLDVIVHSNQKKYPHQKILIVEVDHYIYAVPYVENDSERFLKTIIPSRKLTKKYLGEQNERN